MQRLWFLGFLSKNEATMLLHQEPVGTFLVRLHKNARGTLVCSYVSHTHVVQHHIIQRDRVGFSMLNCAGVYSTIEEMIEHSSFLNRPYSESWIRSQYFLGDASREESESLLEGLSPGTFVVRLQPTTAIPTASLHSANMNASNAPSTPILTQFKETSYVISSVATSGAIRHWYAPRDLQGNLAIAGKTWSSMPSYLADHRSVFTTQFSPSNSRFRARLDSQVVALVSPAPIRHSTRFSTGLAASNSSISSSAGKIPRSLRSTTSDSDIGSSPAHSRDDVSSPRNHRCDSPDFDEDVPIFEIGSLAFASTDPSPFRSANGSFAGSLGATARKNELNPGLAPHHAGPFGSRSNPGSTTLNSSTTDPTTKYHTTEQRFQLNASVATDYLQVMGNRGSSTRDKRSASGSTKWPPSNASDSAPPGSSTTVAHHHSTPLVKDSHMSAHGKESGAPRPVRGSNLHESTFVSATGPTQLSGPASGHHSIASSSAACFAPSITSSQFLPSAFGDSKTLAESTQVPAEAPRARVKWRPLTDQEINPLSLSYKDIWADLLRYYHVPVPEAKIPPKTAPISQAHPTGAHSSHHHASKMHGTTHSAHHTHSGRHNTTSHVLPRS